MVNNNVGGFALKRLEITGIVKVQAERVTNRSDAKKFLTCREDFRKFKIPIGRIGYV